ncbi:MAG: metalloregulator ArsR/SmtB family transcription factor [bacterium]|nr:metalloregulator ArsR/SmtB family transcription factor [bacterium]
MQDTKVLEKILKALANRRRLEILRALKKESVLNVASIAKKIKLSFRSTSKHLNVLKAANIVAFKQIDTNVFYRIHDEAPKIAKYIIGKL